MVALETMVEWSESKEGGFLVHFSHDNFKIVSYFLREFAIETPDPADEIGAFQLGEVIVVGRLWFLEDLMDKIIRAHPAPLVALVLQLHWGACSARGKRF